MVEDSTFACVCSFSIYETYMIIVSLRTPSPWMCPPKINYSRKKDGHLAAIPSKSHPHTPSWRLERETSSKTAAPVRHLNMSTTTTE